MEPPGISLPAEIRAALDAHEAGLAARIEGEVSRRRRPCVYLRSRRVSANPLRRSRLGALLGRPVSAPVLPPAASKFSGRPYTEGDEDWDGWRFLGQIDLSRAGACCPALGIRGLLRLDLSDDAALEEGFRVRWFPSPDDSRAAPPPAVASVGRWEVEHELRMGWSLPHNERDWFSLLPAGLDDLWQAWNDWEPAGFNDDEREELHTILGWPAGGLDEHYGFEPPAGLGDDLSEYEMLLRLTSDDAAGFSWGTNWIYVLVPREDLARGDLSRVVVTGANS